MSIPHLIIIISTIVTTTITTNLITEKVRGIPYIGDVRRLLGNNMEGYMEFSEIVQKYNYNSETHEVITTDGYILTLFRMSNPKCIQLHKTPVLLMHGFLLSSESFVDSGPKSGLAYLIADSCFDLWVGNQRGTFHGRRHVELDPDIVGGKFWDFSYHEMGIYDQPALVDYVLKHTNADTLNYIGFAEGGAAFNIMCSMLPKYNKKIGVSLQLSPCSRMLHTSSPGFRVIIKTIALLQPNTEVFGRNSAITNFFEFLCSGLYPFLKYCKLFIFAVVSDYHEGSIAGRTYQNLGRHLPAGTSQKNTAHFAQAFESDKFRAFDYGKMTNMLMYGVDEAPEYNMTLVTAPVVTFASRSDKVVALEDVKWLSSKLGNLLEYYVVKDKDWNHLDVHYSRYVPEMVFPKVLQYLLRYSGN